MAVLVNTYAIYPFVPSVKTSLTLVLVLLHSESIQTETEMPARITLHNNRCVSYPRQCFKESLPIFFLHRISAIHGCWVRCIRTRELG